MADPWLDSDSEVTQVALAVPSGRVGKPCSGRYVHRHACLRSEVVTTPCSWHGLPRGVLDLLVRASGNSPGWPGRHRTGDRICRGGRLRGRARAGGNTSEVDDADEEGPPYSGAWQCTYARRAPPFTVRTVEAGTYIRTYVRTSADTVRIAGAGLVLCIGLVFVGLFLVWCQCFFLWRHP